MKTDVIFLGAGASVGARFHDNKSLANFIIKGLEVQSNVYLLAQVSAALHDAEDDLVLVPTEVPQT